MPGEFAPRASFVSGEVSTAGGPYGVSAMHKIGRKEEFPEGKAVPLVVEGHSIVVCHLVGGGYYAVEDRCSHDDEELSGGGLEGCELICPRHGARFDVRDGSVTAPPAFYPIDAYAVTLRDGELFVTLDS